MTMKPKPKMHKQEDYELDNIYNDENDRYDSSSNSVIWYSWRYSLFTFNQNLHPFRRGGGFYI